MTRRGRPTKLTPEVQQRIVEALAAGNTRKDSAAYAGIGYSTFEAWMVKTGKIYREFQEAVKSAEARAVIRNVAIIEKAAQEQWQAAAWWLERRRPDDWGRKERIEHSGNAEKPLRVVVQYISDWRSQDHLAEADAAPEGGPESPGEV